MAITTSENDIKERLSVAYLTAVAGRAGCEVREVHVQRLGLDATLSAIRGVRAKLDVQLKATSAPILGEKDLAFDLDVDTYDALRSTEIQSPQLLVVLILPQNSSEWLTVDEEALVLKKCAYWLNLFAMQEVTNKATVRVHLPRANIFGPDAIRDLMERANQNALQGQTGI